MAAAAKAPALAPERSSSLDDVQQLVGHLGSDGVAKLKADPLHTTSSDSNPPRSLKAALDAVAGSGKRKSGSEVSDGTDSEENYDTLKHDPMAVIKGGKGGGFQDQDGTRTPDMSSDSLPLGKAQARLRPVPPRLRSIPVTLNKLKEHGQYVLTANDQALREILKLQIEREQETKSGKRRHKFSDLVFTRRFTAFDRLNVDSAESPFHGFFTLFWLSVALYMIRIAAQNWHQHGNILGTNEILQLMFHRDVIVLGLSDGVLCGVTGFGLLLQTAILRLGISWNKVGWIIQGVWEVAYLVAVLEWTLFREWPWTHTVFFVLHALVMLMKQHSYAFYNGYLSEEYKTREILQRKLKQLEHIAPVNTPSATTPHPSALSTGYLDHKPTASDLNSRRQRSASFDDGVTNIAQVAAAIESGEPLDIEQIQTFERILKWEIDALSENLKGKSTINGNFYPKNLSMKNHYEYICLPTLVYELEYPRSERIDWVYVAEKTIAVFGILGVMSMVSQTFIYPVVMKTIAMKEAEWTLQQRLEAFPWILSDLIFPFMMEYMMSWYVIWECVLNLLAELTYFADRGFYADWWNSVSWDQFARDWNAPVHNFLLRHVYHSSISSLKVNKYTATLITFFLSAMIHELIMWCLFKKLRGYLLCFQMFQIPLVQLSRTRFLKGRATLGNLMFWIGIFTGPSLLCSLYLIL